MEGAGSFQGEIDEALGRGALVVTANNRAARTLTRAYDYARKAEGKTSWRPPRVLTWDAWVGGLWRGLIVEGHATELLLNRSQEHAVWKALLEADEELVSLKTLDVLAEMASEAWTLVCRYDGLSKLRGSGGSSDARAFQRWAAKFDRLCKGEGLLTAAQLESKLCEAAAHGWLKSSAPEMILVGFDALVPARKALVAALQQQGWDVRENSPKVDVPQRNVVEATDEHAERLLAARWIRSFLESHPAARVGVIVPGLEDVRGEMERVFRDVLAPELHDIRLASGAGPFEFSLGVPLSETPMVRVGFGLLQWATGLLPVKQVSALLLSPYVAGGSEDSARAEFDAFELRRARMLRPEIGLAAMISLVQRAKRRPDLSNLLHALKRMEEAIERLWIPGVQESHATWATNIRELLKTAGWGAGDSSIETQMRERWESALDEMTTLDFTGVKVEYSEALEALAQIALRTIFAAESHDAPVQIIGPLEAAGSTFDAVWFLRAGELSWPMPATGSSLLSWQLQRELAMPGADVALDEEAARRMTQRIASSGGAVIFSYARETAAGRQHASSVVSALGLERVRAEDLVNVAEPRSVVALEEIEETERMRPLPDRVLRGGARVLELQAACGFRAFAEQRLWSTEVEDVTLGLDARESGVVLHRALELFWNAVKTQERLRALTPIERRSELAGCIASALESRAKIATEWDDAYIAMQQTRLEGLLDRWLELELQRQEPFEVQENEEEFHDVRVGPLRLSVRMDRVDAVENGIVLIDYKTGLSSPSDWLTERPDLPQLPLYATLSDPSQLRGVAFGLVRAGKDMALKGFATDEHVLPKVARTEAATLEAQVEQWRRVLESLAVEFAEGEAKVKPKQYPGTCSRCGQRLLCRLDTALLELDEDEQPEGGRG